ncbi:hypothetical protein Ancab_030796 [Ancistrocladus abbreviatus]
MRSGCFILRSQFHLPPPLFTTTTPSPFSVHSTLYPHFRRFSTENSRRLWDSQSNAETIRNSKVNSNFSPRRGNDAVEDSDSGRRRSRPKQRRWWSDYSLPRKREEQRPGILEELIDGIWIFKVFRSYGWLLPPLILSSLLTTGPKAFLMALVLPLGLSLLSFAIAKLWGWTRGTIPKPRAKTKRRPPSIDAEESITEEEEQENWVMRKRKKGYQPGVPGSDDSSANESTALSFGGWDELVEDREFETKRASKSAQTMGSRMETLLEKEKLKRRLEGRDLPLLLRLLVAVFPFLGSWTNFL